MDRYLIISPHTGEDCAKVVKQVEAMGYITHFDWGCKDGDHTAWAIIEADGKAEALLSVPSSVRHTARAVKLVKFSPKDAEENQHNNPS
ncbi:MAG: hypothetical protein HYY49_02260 [Ignavibacteriales bacterium]|nr:hypothetical protein [Ignavibacteriales bacterium]